MIEGMKRYYVEVLDLRPETQNQRVILTIYGFDIVDVMRKAEERCSICPNSRTHRLKYPWGIPLRALRNKEALIATSIINKLKN